MAENKYYPIRIRNEEEKILLSEFLDLCKKNNSDGSTEVRKFMRRYVSRYKSTDNQKKTDKKTEQSIINDVKGKDNTKRYPSVQEYLDKIGYVPSYIKKNK